MTSSICSNSTSASDSSVKTDSAFAKLVARVSKSIEFKEFKTGPEVNSGKLVLYRQSEPLDISTVFSLIMHNFYKLRNVSHDQDFFPPFHLDFLRKLCIEEPHFQNFLVELKKLPQAAEFRFLDDSITIIFSEIFNTVSFTHKKLREFSTSPKDFKDLTSAELLSNMRDLSDYFNHAIPVFKKYLLDNPADLHTHKTYDSESLKLFKIEREQFLSQIEILNNYLSSTHVLCYKKSTLFNYFHQFIDSIATSREFIQNEKYIDPIKSVEDRGLFQLIAQEYKGSPHLTVAETKYLENKHYGHLTIEEVGSLALCLENHTKQLELYFFFIFQPLTELMHTMIHFMNKLTTNKNNKAYALKVLDFPKMPRFGNLYRHKPIELSLAPQKSIEEILESLGMNNPTPAPKKQIQATPSKSISDSEPTSQKAVDEPPKLDEPAPIEKTFHLFDLDHNTLRHGLMYAQDLLYLPKTESRFLLALSCCHRLIEQKFSHQIFCETEEEIREHNLFSLASRVKKETISAPLSRLINQIHAAHRWTEHTYTTFLKCSNHVPPLLQKLVDAKLTNGDVNSLIKETLTLTEDFIKPSSDSETFTTKITFPAPPNFPEIDQLLSLVHEESLIAALIKEFKKDHLMLIQLESLFSKSLSSKQQATIIRFIIKLHHALPQHLLRAIHSTKHYEETTEHDLQKLIDHHTWKKPLPNDFKDNLSNYSEIHRLANYPFSATKVQGPLHQLILDAEILRASPHLKTEDFQLNELSFGPLKVTFKNTDPSTLLNESRAFINTLIQKCLTELLAQL